MTKLNLVLNLQAASACTPAPANGAVAAVTCVTPAAAGWTSGWLVSDVAAANTATG